MSPSEGRSGYSLALVVDAKGKIRARWPASRPAVSRREMEARTASKKKMGDMDKLSFDKTHCSEVDQVRARLPLLQN